MAAAKKTVSPKTATAAAKAEATETPTTFEHAGVTFVVPAPLDMPLELLEVASEVEAVRLIVGEESWAEYRLTRPTIRDFQALADKVSSAQAGSGN
ncbi:hypothetical protein OG401_14305 [Kitasatospora purpeofusca]|uniref:hypothetical protein n=1 Tax=Kitasatospora purpeofusca TaxID=67352 RepID=UPI00225399EE|nr:hypothetical protein [Kitasatospora purpeofusca]MCX4685471.1 hypothetical protein [Kitasatospora purpeofusca]